jgi:hypothetical protein
VDRVEEMVDASRVVVATVIKDGEYSHRPPNQKANMSITGSS